MRKIKFRAWDKKEKRFLTQKEMNGIGGFYYNYGLTPHKEYFDLQQYTGLKDRHGREIYEGDIVQETFNINDKPHKTRQQEVFYNQDSCGFHIRPSIPYDSVSLCFSENREVIGNIYENPALLENK